MWMAGAAIKEKLQIKQRRSQMTQTLVHICVGNYEYVGEFEGDAWQKKIKGRLKLLKAAKVMYSQGQKPGTNQIHINMTLIDLLADIYIYCDSTVLTIITPLHKKSDMAKGYRQIHSSIIVPDDNIAMPVSVSPEVKKHLN